MRAQSGVSGIAEKSERDASYPDAIRNATESGLRRQHEVSRIDIGVLLPEGCLPPSIKEIVN